ncbi:hypothetical protein Trco_004691 [Trichoderma cornu-damae]|uniref:CENP-V/GFA domain-containing protein n=1 Tax=Trichoderma cornu-damae TaxID=654480 RepID=A0A9P8QM35_9HYPO|nr:hypothetical protein Trco_004691 [Trichoderma cornu-damae]
MGQAPIIISSLQPPDKDSAAAKDAGIASPPQPQRLPYTGSCHCGAIRYVVFLILPPASLLDCEPPPSRGVQRIYRCNCTVCHKSGFLHVRPASAFDDFFLLSPLDPLDSLGDYLCNDETLHFLYCKTCAVQCLIFYGEGEIVHVRLPKEMASAGAESGSEAGSVSGKAWRPKKVDFTPGMPHQGSYLSVNGHTIDAGQQGFDLREWVEAKSIMYLDHLKNHACQQIAGFVVGNKKRSKRLIDLGEKPPFVNSLVIDEVCFGCPTGAAGFTPVCGAYECKNGRDIIRRGFSDGKGDWRHGG